MNRGSRSLRCTLIVLGVTLACGFGAAGQEPAPSTVKPPGPDRCAESRAVLEAASQGIRNPPADVHYKLAECEAREGGLQSADAHLDLALASDPGHLQALHLRAYVLFSLGRYREALDWAGRFLERQPEGGETRKIAGLARFMLGDRASAEADLRKAAALLPLDSDAQYYLGRVYYEGSKLTLALESFREAVRLAPGSVKAHNHLGQTLEGLTRFEEAKQAYREAIRLEREGPERSEWPYYNLGALLLAEGETDEAVSWLERSLERNPSSVQTRTRLGAAYGAAGRPADATSQLRAVIEAEPGNADAHYHLGRVLMKLGEEADARKHLGLFERLREP